MNSKSPLVFKIIEQDSDEDHQAKLLCQEVLQKLYKKNSAALDEKKEKTHTYIAGFLNGKLCAAATLILENDVFKMENLAVKTDLQNKGIGSEMLKFCEEFAAENNVQTIYCHARDAYGRSAVNFYSKNEYFCEGDEFEEDGIIYQTMWKSF